MGQANKARGLILLALVIVCAGIATAKTEYPATSNPANAIRVYHLNLNCNDALGVENCVLNSNHFNISTPFISGYSYLTNTTNTDFINSSYGEGYTTTDALSFCLWLNTTETRTVYTEMFFGATDGTDIINAYTTQVGLSTTTGVYLNWDGAENQWGNLTTVKYQWVHLCFTKPTGATASAINLYVNGANATNRTVSTGTISGGVLGTDFTFLSRGGSASNFQFDDVLIDDILIFEKELTPSEVTTIYNGIYSDIVTITNPLNSSVINATYLTSLAGTIYINASHNENGYCNINNSKFSINDNTSNIFNYVNNTYLNDGIYSINISCNSSVGNASAVTNFIVNVDYPLILPSYNLKNNITYYWNDTLEYLNVNASDSYSLWSVNITLDNGEVIANRSNIVNTTYSGIETSLNLTQKFNSLNPIISNITIRVCDRAFNVPYYCITEHYKLSYLNISYEKTSTVSLGQQYSFNITNYFTNYLDEFTQNVFFNNVELIPTVTDTPLGEYYKSKGVYTTTAPSTNTSGNLLNITTYWYTNGGGLIYYFTYNYTQELYSLLIDNCTSYKNESFNINTYDEKTGDLINTNYTSEINYYLDNNPLVTNFYQVAMLDRSTFGYCQARNDIIYYGTLEGLLTKQGYGPRAFNLYDVLLTGSNYSAYLLQDTGAGQDVTFTFINSASEAVEGAVLRIYRNIAGVPTNIYTATTDVSGAVTVFLDSTYTYDFTVNATGYPFKTFSLQPVSTTYTITLTQETGTIYTSSYEGIRYKFKINGVDNLPTVVNVSNEYQNITFIVEGTNLEQIGINLSYHNFSCIPTNCYSTLAGPGQVTVLINISSPGTITTTFWLRKNGGETIYINHGVLKGAYFLEVARDSLIYFMDELKASTSGNFRSIFVAVMDIVAIGIGSALGLYGFALVLPAVAVTGVAGYFNLINPFLAMILSVFGIVMYLYSQKKEG